MDLGISGKRALVVGASRGMGAAVVAQLVAAGCSVHAVGRNASAMEKLGEDHPGIDLSVMDASDKSERNILISLCLDAGAPDGWTMRQPDIIVHVTGGSVGIRDPLSSTEDMMKVWMANLGYAHEINRAFLPGMAERGWGRIVHFSSNGVKLATGNVPYISAKGAVEAYVRNMSRIYADKGVVISCVAPGPIETRGIFMYDQNEEWTKAFFAKYVPMKRWGQAEEVAGAVALLCSHHASYMAGAIVPVDGGMR